MVRAGSALPFLVLLLVAVGPLTPFALAQETPPGPPTDRAVSGSCADPRHSQPSPHTTTVTFDNVGNVALYAFSYDLNGTASAPLTLPARTATGPIATTPNTQWVVIDAAGACFGQFMPLTPNAETYSVGVADNPIKRIVQPIVNNPLALFIIFILLVGSLMGWKASSMVQKRAESRKLVDDSPDFHKDKYEVGKDGYFRQRKE